ncbi:MotA/TolQ/ExbB proton channel family protein [Marinicella rhabdoformis]|uniref:MotA/TolQ/ExbB proton channel family protein n=1 Tax=Marinicella rhabdoformis TaxID=2580566 RepID=UPI0012AEBE85|nr:MotA/TolQ/ExbB proton channel family protein [Marinicella rhabdoformis]
MKKFIIIILLTLSLTTWAQDDTNEEAAAAAAVQAPPIPQADEAKSQADIQLAYKKEYAFLSGQVANIQKRIKAYGSEVKIEKRQIEAEISSLENQLLNAETEASALEDEIYEIQRNSESAQDNQGLMDSTIIQASSTMTEYGFEGFDDNNRENSNRLADLEKMAELINQANALIKKQATITKSKGEFFLPNGTKVKGDILNVGQVASYGHSAQGGGVLAPAGENQFKVWADNDQALNADVFNGSSAGMLPIFLYESSIKAIEEKQGKTVLSVINSGGMIAWIITVLGLFALLLIIMRIGFLKSASASTEKLLAHVVEKIKAGDLKAAITYAGSKSSSSARVLLSALRNLNRDRDHLEDIISESILHESAQLNRFGSLIMVVATVAPLLGLLGTVTGMISTFDIITEFGTGDPKLLSSGISIALVTTEVGLAVAIPALMFGNILSGWAERIKDDMEKAALRAINVYQKVAE